MKLHLVLSLDLLSGVIEVEGFFGSKRKANKKRDELRREGQKTKVFFSYLKPMSVENVSVVFRAIQEAIDKDEKLKGIRITPYCKHFDRFDEHVEVSIYTDVRMPCNAGIDCKELFFVLSAKCFSIDENMKPMVSNMEHELHTSVHEDSSASRAYKFNDPRMLVGNLLDYIVGHVNVEFGFSPSSFLSPIEEGGNTMSLKDAIRAASETKEQEKDIVALGLLMSPKLRDILKQVKVVIQSSESQTRWSNQKDKPLVKAEVAYDLPNNQLLFQAAREDSPSELVVEMSLINNKTLQSAITDHLKREFDDVTSAKALESEDRDLLFVLEIEARIHPEQATNSAYVSPMAKFKIACSYEEEWDRMIFYHGNLNQSASIDSAPSFMEAYEKSIKRAKRVFEDMMSTSNMFRTT